MRQLKKIANLFIFEFNFYQGPIFLKKKIKEIHLKQILLKKKIRFIFIKWDSNIKTLFFLINMVCLFMISWKFSIYLFLEKETHKSRSQKSKNSRKSVRSSFKGGLINSLNDSKHLFFVIKLDQKLEKK